MYEALINSYVNRLTLDDINNYAQKNNITLKNGEDKTIYYFIKEKHKDIFKEEPLKILYKIKNKVSNDTFNEILNLYNKYKDKLPKAFQ